MDPTSYFVSIVLVIATIYYFCFRGLNYFKERGIHYKSPLPILGNIGAVIFQTTSLAELVDGIYKIAPDAKYVGIFDFMTPVIMLRDPELIKQIGVKNFDNFRNRRLSFDADIDPLFGKNLFNLQGDHWKDIRSLLSPAFTSSKMRAMFVLMEECADNFAAFIESQASHGMEMELKDAFARYTNDVIATCVFGIAIDSMKNPNNDFYVLGKEATNFGAVRTMKFYLTRSLPWLAKLLNVKLVDDRCAKFFMDVVKTTIDTRDEKGIVRPDMIQLMMESRGKRENDLTIEDMTSQAFIFFFGGFDTTSTHMCFVCHELAVNPNVQQKLQNEIDQVLRDTNGSPTYEAINNMKYLEAIMNEALRIYPVAIATDRVCEKNFQLPPAAPGGEPHIIKKGQIVWFPVYSLHRDPRYFKDPNEFKPERFLEENKDELNMSAYIPFGVGPRMCIGNRFALLETKVLLFHLLARMDLTPCSRTNIPMKLNRKGFAMLAEGGFWIKFQPRKDPLIKTFKNASPNAK